MTGSPFKPLILPRLVIFLTLVPAILFLCAGRLDLPWFWAFSVLYCGIFVGMALSLDRELLKERVQPGAGGEDRGLRAMIMPMFLAHLIVAGLDAGRYGWSPQIPTPLRIAALVLLALAMTLTAWSMRVNRFFSPVVRIQSERGHHVVSTGPYAIVRHPGYTAALLNMACSGVVLGSFWSVVPLLPGFWLILHRTVIEDRFLLANLNGYRDYAARVRHRLIPGVW